MYLYIVQKIRKLTYQQIDFNKYDLCIKNATNSRTEAYSWYLDIVCNKNWEALVLDDYKAVMPLPIRKKYLISYVYNPMWILQLGVFSNQKNTNINAFLNKLFKQYKLVDLRLNTNNLPTKTTHLTKKETHFLKTSDYENLKKSFRSDRKKDLKRAIKHKLTPNWNTSNLDNFIDLYAFNLQQRAKEITNKDITRVRKLLKTILHKNKGELLTIYDKNEHLVAGGFFLKHHDIVTILLSTTDLKNRRNGGNTFLIDTAIQKYQNHFTNFDFGGSSIPSIANYFLSFQAKTANYFQINYNNLPLVYKIFKSN